VVHKEATASRSHAPLFWAKFHQEPPPPTPPQKKSCNPTYELTIFSFGGKPQLRIWDETKKQKSLKRESIIQAIILRSSSWRYRNKQWPNIPRCHTLQKYGNYALEHPGSRLLDHIQARRVLGHTKTFYLVCRWRNMHSHYDIIDIVMNEDDNESLQPESRLHLQIHGQSKYWLAHDAECHVILNSLTHHLVPFQDQNGSTVV